MILISPAKTQDFSLPAPVTFGVRPDFLEDTKLLHKALLKYSPEALSKLMKISAKLAQLNYGRFQDWRSSFKLQKKDKYGEYNFKQAIFTFRGDVYTAFADSIFNKKEIEYMQKNLRIISGFYGLLTPLTYIRAYRLEMSTRLAITEGKSECSNLYEYWNKILTAAIIKTLKPSELIINLASIEYAKAINFNDIKNPKIDVKFQNLKNGHPKTIGLFAKQQRGQMAVWIIKNKIKDIKGLQEYKNNGYVYNDKLSTSDTIVFLKS
ncbi:MAG: cytoplasmic iron level regulating protein YaaA (DUF328/UPF0246 family) [Candidatus Paceibacteria bacterium]|jgi:cytoplasmic iron level regulating protein YaaA (DUF328/UPF0246 family)